MGARTRKMSSRKRKRSGVMGSRKKRKTMARSKGQFKTHPSLPSFKRTAGKLPMGLRVKQPYWHAKSSSTTGGAGSSIWQYHFRINSTFDPDKTGTGTQPMGRDQMAALYNRYMVNECSITLKMFEFTDASGALVVYGIYFTNDGADKLLPAASLKQNLEMLSNRKTRANYRFRDVLHDTSKASTVRQSYKPKVVNPDEDAEHLTAAVGADPTATQYACCFVMADVAASTLSFTPVCRLTYDVTYYDLIPFTAS